MHYAAFCLDEHQTAFTHWAFDLNSFGQIWSWSRHFGCSTEDELWLLFSSCLLQGIALFTPLATILLFAFLKRTEKGELKEASLGESCIYRDTKCVPNRTLMHCFIPFCSINSVSSDNSNKKVECLSGVLQEPEYFNTCSYTYLAEMGRGTILQMSFKLHHVVWLRYFTTF